jgi:hypothetical protein
MTAHGEARHSDHRDIALTITISPPANPDR